MKDGDPQQCSEILSAMNSVFVIASEGTCGFHVVHMGWRTNVPTGVNVLSPQSHCLAGSYMDILMDDPRQCGRQGGI